MPRAVRKRYVVRLHPVVQQQITEIAEKRLSVLIREYTGQLHCLKGILILTGGTVPRTAPTCPPDHSLRRCFDGALQRLGAC